MKIERLHYSFKKSNISLDAIKIACAQIGHIPFKIACAQIGHSPFKIACAQIGHSPFKTFLRDLVVKVFYYLF